MMYTVIKRYLTGEKVYKITPISPPYKKYSTTASFCPNYMLDTPFES